MPQLRRIFIRSKRLRDRVERINLTDDPSQVGIALAPGIDRYQVTIMPEDICSDNYAAFSEFPKLAELSFNGITLCHHDPSRPPPRAPLPRFHQLQLARVSGQLATVYLSWCGLCDRCVEEMGLRSLRSVQTLSLAQNRLTEFPLVVAESLHCIEEFDVSGNNYLSLGRTEAKLRQVEADLPVMRQLRVFKASYCPLKGQGMVFYRLIPPSVERLEFSHCQLTSIATALADILAKSTVLRYADLQNNSITHLPPELSAVLSSVVNLDNNRIGYDTCACTTSLPVMCEEDVEAQSSFPTIPAEEVTTAPESVHPGHEVRSLWESARPRNVGVEEEAAANSNMTNAAEQVVSVGSYHSFRGDIQPDITANGTQQNIRHFQAAAMPSELVSRTNGHDPEVDRHCSARQCRPPVEVSDADDRARDAPCSTCPRLRSVRQQLLSVLSTLAVSRQNASTATGASPPQQDSHQQSRTECPFLTGDLDSDLRDFLSMVFSADPAWTRHHRHLVCLEYLVRVHRPVLLSLHPQLMAGAAEPFKDDQKDHSEVCNCCPSLTQRLSCS